MFLRKGKKPVPVTFSTAESHFSEKRDQVEGGQKVFAFCYVAQGGESKKKNNR